MGGRPYWTNSCMGGSLTMREGAPTDARSSLGIEGSFVIMDGEIPSSGIEILGSS